MKNGNGQAGSVPATVNILGVPVSVIDMDGALARIDAWIAARRPGYVCFRDVHGVMLARKDGELRAAHEAAGMVGELSA